MLQQKFLKINYIILQVFHSSTLGYNSVIELLTNHEMIRFCYSLNKFTIFKCLNLGTIKIFMFFKY